MLALWKQSAHESGLPSEGGLKPQGEIQEKDKSESGRDQGHYFFSLAFGGSTYGTGEWRAGEGGGAASQVIETPDEGREGQFDAGGQWREGFA